MPVTEKDLESTVSRLMDEKDGLWDTLNEWVNIPSVNDGTHDDDVTKCRTKIIEKFKAVGVDAQPLSLTYNGRDITPLVYADCKSKQANAPTVLIYSHYDVQPADKKDGWTRTTNGDPFEPTNVEEGDDERKYGRGAADDKSGIVMHLGVVKAFGSSDLPVNLKLVFEGEEETGYSTLEDYLNDFSNRTPRPPELEPFTADLIVVADTGNSALGTPTLTTTLRGYAKFEVEVHTLDSPVHSGMYGGPAPDAFMALVRLLASLHDDKGDVAVAGLIRDDKYQYAPVDEEQFLINAGVRRGVPLVGTGSLAQRLGGRPAINVTWLEGVTSDQTMAANVLCPKATAWISVRLAPSQDPEQARQAIEEHLNSVRPWGIEPTVTFVGSGAGFQVNPAGKHFSTAAEALSKAYKGKKTMLAGVGGSIPLVNALQKINPDADVVLWGCEEPQCRIHGVDESVSKNELTRMTTAEALLLQDVANSV